MRAKVSRQSIDNFQSKANDVFEVSKELKNACDELDLMYQKIESLIFLCQKSKALLVSDVSKLSNLIEKLKEKLKESKKQLAATPKTITGPSGVIPNPIYLALELEIASLAARIASYVSMLSKANNKINQLSKFIDCAEKALDFIKDSKNGIEMLANKSLKNSDEVISKMTKIKRIVSTYLNLSISLASVSSINSLFNSESNRYGRIISKTKSNNVQVFCRKEDLAGMTHPVTGIPYERFIVTYSDGITKEVVAPRFPTDFTATLPKEMFTAKERIKGGQFEECTRQLRDLLNSNPRLKKIFTPEQIDQIEHLITPRGYTWHHEPEEGKISLVNTLLHKKTGHTGGRNLWGGGSAMR